MRPWANTGTQVWLRRRDGPRALSVNMRNVGAQRGIYGDGAVGQRREDFFRSLEDAWPRVRDDLVDSGIAMGNDRHEIALFVGLLIARTREHIAQAEFVLSVAESTAARPVSRDAVRRYLAEEHLGFDPADAELEAAWSLVSVMVNQGDLPTREALLGMSLDIVVSGLAPSIESMTWTVETCRRPATKMKDAFKH